jgi:hypothetical protein
MENAFGYLKGETCNRDGCKGVIDEHETDRSCSCHINPPCSYCIESREYCPVCDWDGREEQIAHEKKITESYTSAGEIGSFYNSKEANVYRENVLKMMDGKMPRPNTLMYIDEGHTHFSMIKKGVFPASMTADQLLEKIKGTFGGRFERLNTQTGAFKYIAYTD